MVVDIRLPSSHDRLEISIACALLRVWELVSVAGPLEPYEVLLREHRGHEPKNREALL